MFSQICEQKHLKNLFSYEEYTAVKVMWCWPVPEPSPGVGGVFEFRVDKFITQDRDVQGGQCHLSCEEHQENCLYRWEGEKQRRWVGVAYQDRELHGVSRLTVHWHGLTVTGATSEELSVSCWVTHSPHHNTVHRQKLDVTGPVSLCQIERERSSLFVKHKNYFKLSVSLSPVTRQS